MAMLKLNIKVPTLFVLFILTTCSVLAQDKKYQVVCSGFYNVENLLADTLAFIDTVIKKPVYIFGHSMGGAISFLIAAQKPEMVKGLIIYRQEDAYRHKKAFYW